MRNTVEFWASETADKMKVALETATSLELYKAGGEGMPLWGSNPSVQALIFNFLFKKLKGLLSIQLKTFTFPVEGY